MKIDLSNSEWKLMRRLWERSPRTIMELTAAVREETCWSKNTVITMLMMSAMVESRRLTEADIAELSAILDKAGGERK